MAPFRLVSHAKDICTQKILVAARAAGVEVALEAGREGAVPELRRGDRAVKYTNAILRYVGRVFEGGDIYGNSFIDSAQVDSWLDWGEMELGSSNPPQLEQAVQALERHLADRTFLVGQRYTLADASISCSLHSFQKQGKPAVASLSQATTRWLGTCTNHEAFLHVFGKGAAAAAAGSAASAPRSAAPASAGGAASKPKAAAGASGAAASGSVGVARADDRPVLASYSSCVGGRTALSRIMHASDKGASFVGQIMSVCGWARTAREQNKGKLIFVELNDGSCPENLQVVLDCEAPGFDAAVGKGKMGTGASLQFRGELVASPGGKQAVELLVKGAPGHEVKLFGGVDADKYPLAKSRGGHSMEFLRSIAHLRPRSNMIGCVARVRNALAQATHEFFRTRGFMYVHTPLITAADCEGAGEMFQVTTLLHDEEKAGLPKLNGKIDYTKDFFGKPSYLTVSGQLSVENYASALSNVYTFGPTFRAENSHTARHLAEFWMIEPELCFADLKDDMDCAEDYLKYCVQYAYDHNYSDLQYFDETERRVAKEKEKADGKPAAKRGVDAEKFLLERLENLLASPFARVSYTEAIEILKKHSPQANFNEAVEWGMDLGSEHERYLAEVVNKKPTIVYNYPKDIKAFYMRLNDDGKTVGAMDVLVPAIGEVIGGSQREERLEVLDSRLEEMKLNPEDYWWYRDLRKYGSVPHSGFGLGFERLIMLTTGVDNIRDVIPFPRWPGHAEF